jgi:hypothetical protein
MSGIGGSYAIRSSSSPNIRSWTFITLTLAASVVLFWIISPVSWAKSVLELSGSELGVRVIAAIRTPFPGTSVCWTDRSSYPGVLILATSLAVTSWRVKEVFTADIEVLKEMSMIRSCWPAKAGIIKSVCGLKP